MNQAKTEKLILSDTEWQERLTPEQYQIARQHGTERAFTSPLNDEKGKGTYLCVACDSELFTSDAKFDSGTGWPSYFEPVSQDAVEEHKDRSFFMVRTEVRCAKCDSHLGHVFNDGPHPTGLRYCINGAILTFREDV